jgi:hypothetical protein
VCSLCVWVCTHLTRHCARSCCQTSALLALALALPHTGWLKRAAGGRLCRRAAQAQGGLVEAQPQRQALLAQHKRQALRARGHLERRELCQRLQPGRRAAPAWRLWRRPAHAAGRARRAPWARHGWRPPAGGCGGGCRSCRRPATRAGACWRPHGAAPTPDGRCVFVAGGEQGVLLLHWRAGAAPARLPAGCRQPAFDSCSRVPRCPQAR